MFSIGSNTTQFDLTADWALNVMGSCDVGGGCTVEAPSSIQCESPGYGVLDPCDVIAERLLVQEGGAVAVIGYSRSQVAPSAQADFTNLFRSLSDQNPSTLGELLVGARMFRISNDVTARNLMLLGDPALDIRTRAPAAADTVDVAIGVHDIRLVGEADGEMTYYVNTNSTLAMSARIRNPWRIDAVDVDVAFWQGEPGAQGSTLLGSTTLDLVPAYDSVMVDFNVGDPSGNFEVFVVLDPDDEITERNEDNNVASRAFLGLPYKGDYPVRLGMNPSRPIVVADLRSDMGREFLVSGTTEVRCYAVSDTSQKWSHPINLVENETLMSTPVVGHMFKSPARYVALETRVPLNASLLRILSGESGATIGVDTLSQNATIGNETGLAKWVLTDLGPDDPTMELVGLAYQQGEFIDETRVQVYSPSDSLLSSLLVEETGGSPSAATMAIADIDANGSKELIVLIRAAASAKDLKVYRYGSSGFSLWWELDIAAGVQHQEPTIVLIDHDGDGDVEILFSGTLGTDSAVRLYNANGSPVWGALTVTANAPPRFAAGDLDGDGQAEIVVADNGRLRVLSSASGQVLNSLTALPGAPVSGPYLVDLDADGMQDIVVLYETENGYFYPTQFHTYLYVLDGGLNELEPLRVFSPQTATTTHSLVAPALDDLDGDGRYEMIYVSTDNLLHVFELGSAAGEAAWSQRFGNALNTGLNEQPLLGDGYVNPVSLYQKTRMLGHVALDSTAAPSLYVGHGTEIRVDASVSDPFQLRAFGSVRMKGSATAPVVIHSDPPASGTATWGGLYVDDRFARATDPDTLVYVELSDASIGIEVHSPLHVTASEVSNVFDAGIVTDDTLSVKASDIVASSEIGIELLAGGRGWISDSSVDGGGTGVLAAQGSPLTIRNSTISNVGAAGVVAGDTLWFDRSSVSASSGLGIKLTSGAVARIRQSTVSDTDSTSVLCDSCAYTTTIDSTTVSSSGRDGIHVIGSWSWQGTDGIALDSCTVAASAGAGVRFDGAHGTILRSRLEGNYVGVVTTAGGGLTTIENSAITGGSAGVDHGSPVSITGTTISSVQDVGVASGDTLWVEASEVTTSAGIGVRLGPGAAGWLDDVLVQYTDSTAVLCDSCLAGTVINRTNVQSAGLHGIHAIGTAGWAGTAGITIDSCSVDGSPASGIRFDSAHGTISRCSIDGGAEGVYVGAGCGLGSLVDSDISDCDVGVESLSPLAVTNVDIDNAAVTAIIAYDTLLVDGCQIGGSPGVGIHLRAGALGVISDAGITGSDFSAIVCDTCATGTSIRRTTIDSAGLHGIHVVMNSDVLIDSCVVVNSASAAVRFEWGGGLVRKSRLDGNAGGVVCFESSSPVIRECSMDGNTGGVAAVYDSYPVVGYGTSGGLNCITNTTGYNVSNLNSPGTVYARHDHFGSACCKPTKFFGNVSCDSCETASACDAAAAPASVVVVLEDGEANGGPEEETGAGADSLAAQSERAPVLPKKLDLVSAAPNPFNPSVRIRYAVPAGGADVELTIYNVRGQRVAVLQDGPTPAGYHEVVWHGLTARGNAAASGVYFVRMSAGGFKKTMRLVLLK